MTYKIVPRVDDGTFDLMAKYEDGRVDILGNFDSLEGAKEEIQNMKSPMSQADSLNFMRTLKSNINKI
jgi:hypothetical protein